MHRPRLSRSPGERVRILFLIDVLSTAGGAERLALSIATRLDPERFEVTACVSRWPPPPDPSEEAAAREARRWLEQAEVRFLPLGHSRKAEVAPWVRLYRFLRREQIDVLHSHKFGSNVWGALVGTLARVPVIVAHEHSWSYEGQPLRRFLDRELVSRAADRLVAVSREDRRRMTEVERIDPSRTIFIPNGIQDPPAPSRHDLRAELGIEPNAPVVGLVGVLRPEKSIQVLLRAMPTLLQHWPTLKVLIAGDGSEHASLQSLARELGIEESVRLLGYRSDVADLLATFDVAVSCSKREGSPLALMEYMATGLPIVATAVGGVPDLIENGEHGLLVARDDPPALAAAITEMLSDPARAAAMGARARERRQSEFDLDTLVRRVEKLYLELLARKRGLR